MVSVTDGNLPANALSASLWAFLLSGVAGPDEVLPDEAIPDGAGPDEGAAGPFHLYVVILTWFLQVQVQVPPLEAVVEQVEAEPVVVQEQDQISQPTAHCQFP